MRRRQLEGYKFRRQHVVAGFIVDFHCPALQLAVEVDGPTRRYPPRYDERRSQIQRACGVAIVRFSSEAVMHDIENVVLSLRDYVQRRRHDFFPG